jgi:hypothetical protein
MTDLNHANPRKRRTLAHLAYLRNGGMKLVPSILSMMLVVTCTTVTATLAYSQGGGSRGTANPVTPGTLDSPLAPKTPLVQSPPTTQPMTPEVPSEAEVLSVEVQYPKDTERRTEVALGSYVIVTLSTELPTARQTPTNKLGLFINDAFIKGLEPMPVPAQPKSVMFQLKRTDDNRDAWSVLFGHKHFGLRSRKTGDCDSNDQIAFTVGLQDGSWAAKNPKTLCLEYLPDNTSKFLVLPISFVIAIGTFILGMKSSMLRDSGDPRTDGKLGTYSLGRCQMALWFATVVFAFLFTYAVTGDTSPVPQGTLILMGIGAGTALGAAAIDQNKRTASKTDLVNWTAEKAALPQTIQDLQSKLANTQGGDPNLPVLQQQLQTAQQRLLSVSAQLAQIPSTQVAASEGFIRDVLSDVNGISFHRVQVLGWMFVFWAVFLSSLFKKVTMVDFDTTQLALMGISGSTYLGFKLQEKQ